MPVQRCNVNGMDLVPGEGNQPGRAVEKDKINTVYILVGTPALLYAKLFTRKQKGAAISR